MEALSLVAEHDGPQRPGVLSAERRGSPVKLEPIWKSHLGSHSA